MMTVVHREQRRKSGDVITEKQSLHREEVKESTPAKHQILNVCFLFPTESRRSFNLITTVNQVFIIVTTRVKVP